MNEHVSIALRLLTAAKIIIALVALFTSPGAPQDAAHEAHPLVRSPRAMGGVETLTLFGKVRP